MSNKTLFRILYGSLFVWVLAAGMGSTAQAAVITNDGETIFYKGGVTKGDAAKEQDNAVNAAYDALRKSVLGRDYKLEQDK